MSKQRQSFFKKIIKTKETRHRHPNSALRHSAGFRFIIFCVTVGICSLFFTVHINESKYIAKYSSSTVGHLWPYQNIVVEFSFPIFKPEERYRNDTMQARQNTPLVFERDSHSESRALRTLDSLIGILKSLPQQVEDVDVPAFSGESKKAFAELSTGQRNDTASIIRREIINYIIPIYKRGFININKSQIKTTEITIQYPPNYEQPIKSNSLADSLQIIDDMANYFFDRIPGTFIAVAEELTIKILFPNLTFSHVLTLKSQENAVRSVQKTTGIIQKGQTLIEKGEKVTADHVIKLESYNKSKFLRSEGRYSFWIYLGSLGHAAIIYLILLLYLYFIRKKIFEDNFQMMILSLNLILVSIMSWLSIEIPSDLPLEYLVFLPSISMLTAIVFDSRTAFYSTVTMALLVASIRGNDYTTALSMMFAGMLAAYTVRDIQNRTQMFKSIFYILIGFFIPIMAFSLQFSAEQSMIFKRLLIATINSAISPLVTFGLLLILERTTNIATDLRLQEFNNLNHPLLIKLSDVAPGTYQHTLSVANLAERCATAVQANQLLAKVGTYFHDIGKIARPEYFAENQTEGTNKHELLPPKKSAQAIRDHVFAGVELARQYHLPQRITNFIPMHHGTSLIKHFYAKALEESKNIAVKEADFRYPGPKPNSKETAIVMICDSAEALSRIEHIDIDELDSLIEKNIRDRLLDGQFDESNLTMKELQIIKATCLKSLAGITHQRVKYKEIPQQQADNPQPDDHDD